MKDLKKETNFKFRLIEQEDIELIFFLRSISKENVLKRSSRIDSRAFLLNIIDKKADGYYCFENAERIIGYYRHYYIDGRIEIGSWITNPQAPFKEKILFDLEFKKMVFGITCSETLFFDVRRHNNTVWKHHERFGAELIREDENNRYYKLNSSTFKLLYDAKIHRIN